jgi:hypothetical protein
MKLSSGRSLPRVILLTKEWLAHLPSDRDEELVRHELWRVAQRMVDELLVDVRPQLFHVDASDDNEPHWTLMLGVGSDRPCNDDPRRILDEWEARLEEFVRRQRTTTFTLDGPPATGRVVEALDWVGLDRLTD